MTEDETKNEFLLHWPLVVACAAGVGIGVASLPFYTQSVFITEWISEFGWSRAEASYGILGSTFALALVSPFVGAAVDRFGLVRPVAFAIAGLVLCFGLFAAFMNSLLILIGLNILMAILGGASSPIAYTRAINAVFARQRGLALGIVLSGTGIAATFGPPVVSDLIEAQGWRAAYWSLAGFTALMGLLIIFSLSRIVTRKPGPSASHAAIRAASSKATRTPAFWHLLAAVFFLAIGVGGLIIHFVPILRESGLSAEVAAQTAGSIGIAVILGRLVVGAAVDRFFAPYVAASVIVLCMSGILSLAMFASAAAGPAAFAIGFSIGAEVDLIGYLTARYFGMTAYGRIYGRQYAAFLIGTGLSPVLFGAIRDSAGNYTLSLFTAAWLLATAAIFFATLPKFNAVPAGASAH